MGTYGILVNPSTFLGGSSPHYPFNAERQAGQL